MSLWVRDGDRLRLRDKPEDFLKIIGTDGYYPETVECESADGFIIEFKQQAPNLYIFSKEIGQKE